MEQCFGRYGIELCDQSGHDVSYRQSIPLFVIECNLSSSSYLDRCGVDGSPATDHYTQCGSVDRIITRKDHYPYRQSLCSDWRHLQLYMDVEQYAGDGDGK